MILSSRRMKERILDVASQKKISRTIDRYIRAALKLEVVNDVP